MNTLNILLFASSAQQGGEQGSMVPTFIFLGLMILVFYFFMIRPQQKKNKEAQQFRERLQKGDEVVTIGGLHGKVVDVQDTTVVLEVENAARIKVEKSAIASTSGEGKK